VLTSVCSNYGWRIDYALHDVPLAQLLAMNACHAWGQGMEPAEGSYEDRVFERALTEVMAGEPLT
jgi:hypothetical protein